MNRLEERVCIVTGGSLGIGAATCRRLAREGGRVAITDILEEEGARLRDEIAAEGGEAVFLHLDVTDEGAVRDTIRDVFERWGRLDVLVNNAGIAGVNKPTHEIDAAEWDKVMKVNVSGVFFCTKHAVPPMRRTGGGSIVNLSSIYGIVGAPDVPPYHASKGAVREMSKTDAVLYAKDRIRVNSVHPGFIWTPLVSRLAEDLGLDPETFRAELGQRHALGHVGEPEDIAAGIAYLASDDARFVTGSELVIDGGYVCQ